METLKGKKIVRVNKAILNSKVEEEKLQDCDRRCVGYSRVSSEEQKRNGISLADQTQRIDEYCKKNNLPLIDTKEETCSGKILCKDRPVMSEIIKKLEEGEYTDLIFTNLDRLGRVATDIKETIISLAKKGLNVRELENKLELDDNGLMILGIRAEMIEYERRRISTRTKAGMEYLKKNGLSRGRPPWGFRIVIVDGERKVIENADDIETIDIILELRNNEKRRQKNGKIIPISFQDIADILTKLGRKNKTGKVHWTDQNVCRLYRNFKYA